MGILDKVANIFVNNTKFQGTSIIVTNGKVMINGVDVTPDSKTINIKVEGNIDSLSSDICQTIAVNGNVGKLQNGSGDIECKDVNGDLTSGSGDIKCGNVGGSVKSGSGDVECGNIGGGVQTGSGDVYRR